ncbi:MAG: hypothetical protein Hals2KO_15470 [Halioglobus sp.]
MQQANNGLRAHTILLLALLVPSLAVAQHYRDNGKRGIAPKVSQHMMEVVPPAGSNLQAFRAPAYEGRYLRGQPIPDPERPSRSQISTNEQLAYRAGDAIRRSGDALYLDLLRLGENRDIITKQNLSTLYTSARPPVRTQNAMSGWSKLIVDTARGTLNDAAYREVFCVEEAPCPLDKYSGVRPFETGSLTPIWGAGYNEFRFRAAFQVFQDKYLNEILDWAASLDRSAISVGNVRIRPYDFAAGAYVWQIGLGDRTKAAGLQNVSTPEYDIDYRFRQNGEIASMQLTWKLPRDKAKAVREKMQALKTNQLYVVARGEIAFDEPDRVAMQNDKLLAMNHYFDLTDDAVALYYDNQLTDLALRLRIR